MRLALLFLGSLLAGCEPESVVEREQYKRLEERLLRVESQVARIEAREIETAKAPTIEKVEPVEVKPRYTHQLVGTSYDNEGERFYSSEAKCEAARQALLNAWAKDDEQARQRGVVYRNRPTPACLPI